MNWRRIAATIVLAGTTGTAGAVGRLADVTVYDRAENRTLPVYQQQGRYYVAGRPGNEYQIRVRNRTGDDLLAVVSVDGVNAVNGETAHWGQTGYVLGPHQAYDIRGWRKSLQRVSAFYFTDHQNSYAARTGRPDNVGVVGVALFRRKAEPAALIEEPLPRPRLQAEPWGSGARQDSPYPSGADSPFPFGGRALAEGSAEYQYRRERPQQSPSLGTGHGRSETSRVGTTQFERATAGPEEVIAIHYDTHANLVALGVIRAPRIATPFPGHFVPDPR
jgi:hypothetical protein